MKNHFIKLYLIHQNGKPLKSVDGEYLVFDKIKPAYEWIRKARERGDIHIYGYDEFNAKQLRVVRLPGSYIV